MNELEYNHTLYLLLGANLGSRTETFHRAIDAIIKQVGPVVQTSDVYETAPWGVVEQPAFLNQVVLVKTNLQPEEVLQQTQAIELALGRVRLEKWGSRAIDIDILYYDQLIWQSNTLVIPHPYLHQRRFTLVPLAQISPNFVHPISGQTSVALLATCEDEGVVTLFDGHT